MSTGDLKVANVNSAKNLFAKITKAIPQSDGTVIVEGIASSATRDVQGEIVTPDAMKAALPEYMKFPALREMHESWAAGKTVQARVGDDGCTYIRAKVVDAAAVQKVREGVYGGFSIGGHVPEGGRNADDPSIIEAIQLVEISLVDRPANPDAVIQLFKAHSAKERRMDPKDQKDEAAQKAAAADVLVAAGAQATKTRKGAAGPGQAPHSQPVLGKDDLIAMASQLLGHAAAMGKDDGDADDVAADDDAGAGADDVAMDDDVAAAAKDDDVADTGVTMAAKDDDVAADDDVSAAAKDDSTDADADADAAKDDDVTAAAKPATKKVAASQSDALAKATSALIKVTKQLDVVTKQNAELRARLATKGALKRVPVAKSDDTNEAATDKGFEEITALAKSGAGPEAVAIALAKMVHARGGTAGR